MRSLLLFVFSVCFLFGKAQNFTLFIGTYTGSGSKGIYVYHFNANSGKAEWVSNTDSVKNPSYLAVSKDKKYLFAVNETGGDNPGHVSSFSFDEGTGRLKFINNQLSGGDNPCYVSVTNNNRWVVVANYSGGNVSVFPVDEDGSLRPYTQHIQDSGTSVNKARQEKAHVHAAVLSPDERYLFTPDLGIDKVMIYALDQSSATTQLIKQAPALFAESVPGSGPRHFVFHPNQKFAYLAEELSGTVAVYKYNNGKLKFVQRIFAHPETYKGDISSADIHLSPDGKFLYMSNRGDENTITIFSANKLTGKLTLAGYQPVMGKTPRNFMIDPKGNFLLVANQETDNVVIFRRNKQSGLLQITPEQIKVPKPVCLKMID